jgi:predicted DNA-binding transcriptional regulator AlpA
MNETPKLLTAKLLLRADEACDAMSVCRKTLYSLTAPRGPIPVVKIGKTGLRYSVAAINAWIEQQQLQAVGNG